MSGPWDLIELRQGDITKVACDVIVNAANTTLLGGGGVDGAIHRAAGSELLAECRGLGGCPTGMAKLTGGYDLPAGHVIHTVGPVYRGGGHGEPGQLASCYKSSLTVAADHQLHAVAFPAISCGAYGYPLAEAARIALSTTEAFLRNHRGVERVIFVLFAEDAFGTFQREREVLSQDA